MRVWMSMIHRWGMAYFIQHASVAGSTYGTGAAGVQSSLWLSVLRLRLWWLPLLTRPAVAMLKLVPMQLARAAVGGAAVDAVCMPEVTAVGAHTAVRAAVSRATAGSDGNDGRDSVVRCRCRRQRTPGGGCGQGLATAAAGSDGNDSGDLSAAGYG
ncbi:hypothetical protein BC831DRAFT_492165 [Entophlyctis helioformis]|nr:hypothetical protein BC831DRAFT_492165 [Entophlyctis helioformis]